MPQLRRQGTPSETVPTLPDHATQADDGEGDTDEESSEEGDVCGVEWEYDLNGQATKTMTSWESDGVHSTKQVEASFMHVDEYHAARMLFHRFHASRTGTHSCFIFLRSTLN